jgi:tetratricopeptide (TPR) repeat protein
MSVHETITRYRNLLERFPENELARFSLGKAFYDTQQFEAAREQFELALIRKPDWMAVEILLGRCHLALLNHSAAKKSFERAKQLAIEQNHSGPLAEVEQLLADLQSPSSRA